MDDGANRTNTSDGKFKVVVGVCGGGEDLFVGNLLQRQDIRMCK